MSSGRDPRAGAPGCAALAMLAVAACNGASGPSKTDEVTGSARAPAAPAAPAPAAPPVATAPPDPPAHEWRASNPVALDEPKLVLPRQESFRLLEAGKGNKVALRYALAAGTVSFTTRTTLSSRQLDRGVFSAPVALPELRDGFAITTAADRPGTLALRALPGEAAATSPAADAYLAPWRTLLQGRRITLTLDDRGQLATVMFNDDPTGARSARARDELVQRLLAVIVPLPVEPVAAGASWRVVTIFRQGPAYAKQTATYTLVSRAATWKLHVKLQRVAEEQRVADPSLPPDTTADLVAMFRAFEGSVEVDPRQPLIAEGSLAVESRLHVRLQATGQAAVEQILEDTGTVALSHAP